MSPEETSRVEAYLKAQLNPAIRVESREKNV